MKKEPYEKPQIKTEEIKEESFSFGAYESPMSSIQPNFGICCK